MWRYQITSPMPAVYDSVEGGVNPKLTLKPVIVMLHQKESPGLKPGDKIPRTRAGPPKALSLAPMEGL